MGLNISRYKKILIALILLHVTNALPINETFNGYLFTISDQPDTTTGLMSQSDANQWCQNNKNTLLEITDSKTQGIVVQFINAKGGPNIYLGIRQIYTNGMRTTTAWEWVNGRSYVEIGSGISNQQTADHAYVYLILNQSGIFYIADNLPTNNRNYICEVMSTGNTCNGGFKQNDRCFTRNTDQQQSWFGARSKCFGDGGDLASFDFVNDLKSLYSLNGSWINPSTPYWIGLRRQWWKWQSSGSEIIYTNWQVGHPMPSPQSPQSPYNCLCLMPPYRDWSECDCNQNSQFICLKADNDSSRPTTTSSVPAAMFSVPTTTSSVPTSGPSKMTPLPAPTRESFSTSGQYMYRSIDTTIPTCTCKPCSCELQLLSVGLGVGLGIGIPALLAILFLTVWIVREKRRLRKYESSSAATKTDGDSTKPTPTYESIKNRSGESQDPYTSLAYQELSVVGNSDTRHSDS